MDRIVIACALAMASPPTLLHAQITDRQVQAGLALLPAELRTDARVVIGTEDGYTVRREGTNAWSCRIWQPVANRLAANCHHRVLTALLDRNQELYDDGVRGEAFYAQLAEDVRTGRLVIPPGSMEITGAGAIAEGRRLPERMEGYYFLYFPFATESALGVPDEDPGDGKPWLHNAGTAKAHLMWRRSHVP